MIKEKIRKSVFVKSFDKTNRKKIFKTFAIDSIYTIILILLLFAYAFNLIPLANTLQNAQMLTQSESIMTDIQIGDQLEPIKEATERVVTATVAGLILMLVLVTLFKGLIWRLIVGKKVSASYFLKLAGINVVLSLVYILILNLFKALINPIAFSFVMLLILFPLFAHITNITYAKMAETDKARTALKKIFTLAFGKIHKFILSYILIGISFVILIYLLNGIGSLIATVGAAWLSFVFGILILALLVLFIAGARVYIYNVIQKIDPAEVIKKREHKTIKVKKKK